MPWIKTVSISDFEQGNITSSGESSSTYYVRSSSFTTSTSTSVKLSATTSKENVTLKFRLAGYSSPLDSVPLFEKSWYSSGTTVDLSQNFGFRCLRVVIEAVRGSDLVQITPEDITSCTLELEYHWIDSGGKPVNPDFPQNTPDKPFTGTLPKNLWRIDPYILDGLPHHKLMPGLKAMPYIPVKQCGYITVHDMRTPQLGFDNNGLCVLTPTSCQIEECLNGSYIVKLEHPVDELGKWRYILEYNILKVLGQLFRIVRVDHVWTSNSGRVVAYAEHIFYQMNDAWIEDICGVAGLTGQQLVNSALSYGDYHPETGNLIYAFTGTSNIPASSIPEDVGMNKWKYRNAGMTLIDFFLGSDGMLSTFGGELYRDNFYFSINERMEESQDNAFDLRIGMNLTGITRSVDASNVCTYYGGSDNFGNGYWISWIPTLFERQFPHHVVRTKKYNYRENNMSVLVKDVERDFYKNCSPVLGYRVNMVAVQRNPDFQIFTNLPRFRVGDKGRVYDERAGKYVNMEITRTLTDAITGEITEVEFGSFMSFTRPDSYNPSQGGEQVEIVPVKAFIQLHDRNGKKLFDKNKKRLVKVVKI